LSTVKAAAEVASSVPTPIAAAKMWTKQPVRMPKPPTMPARTPERSELAMM